MPIDPSTFDFQTTTPAGQTPTQSAPFPYASSLPTRSSAPGGSGYLFEECDRTGVQLIGTTREFVLAEPARCVQLKEPPVQCLEPLVFRFETPHLRLEHGDLALELCGLSSSAAGQPQPAA